MSNAEFKHWLEKYYYPHQLRIERRLSKLEAKQWIQIGLLVIQLVATAALFMRV